MVPAAHAKGEAIMRDAGGATQWSIAGAVAGLMMVACMSVPRVLTGVPALPELFQDQVIALMPGSVFGFLLDHLQFAAKPLLLVGLASLGVPGGAVLGWLYGRALERWGWLERHSLASGTAYGLVVWLAVELCVAVWGDGPGAAITSALLLLASAEMYGIGLVELARILEAPSNVAEANVPLLDRGRRVIVLGGLTGGALVLTGGALARMLISNTEQPTTEPIPADTMPVAAAVLETPAAAHAATSDGVARANGAKTGVAIPPGVADEITPNDHFYLVSKNFNDPRVSADTWSLEVSGLVAQPRRFSYEEILGLATKSQYTTLECTSNTLGGKLMSNALWTGVPLAQLLGDLGVQPTARAVIFRSADNYYESFPLVVALAPGVMLAHTMNGTPLPDKHGFPLRMILPGRYGVKNPKWITRIELAAEPIDGYWVRRGWDREADVQTVARIDTPMNGDSVPGSRSAVGGVAFAGGRGISRVEASLDGGTTWRQVETRAPLGSSTWVQWATRWDDVSPGTYTVLARATDGTGVLQTPEETGSFPRGATGYHRAMVEVQKPP
jgi:DMSO/TMAO reductase YedYZ molybdopterin-dependent catalytic subunit